MVDSVSPARQRWVVGSLARIPLGLAVLAGERVRSGIGLKSAPPAIGTAGALAVGAADTALTAAGHRAAAVSGAVTGASRRRAGAVAAKLRDAVPAPVARLAAAPSRRIRSAAAKPAERTIAHGWSVVNSARADAVALLDGESRTGLSWVRDRIRPVVIDDVVASAAPPRPTSQRVLLGPNTVNTPR